jgi:hypothetical protein
MSVLTQNQDAAEGYCGGRSLRSILERAELECAFIVPLFGCAVSVIVFLGEYFHRHIKQHKYWSA